MDAQEYMNEIVLPTVLDFKADPRSRRHAYLASIVTFHVKDYLSKAGEVGIEDVIRSICGDSFDVVRGICNGAKHKETDSRHVIPFSSGQDWDRPPARAGVMVCGVSRIGDSIGGREIGEYGSGGRDIYFSTLAVLQAFCKSYPVNLGDTDLGLLSQVLED